MANEHQQRLSHADDLIGGLRLADTVVGVVVGVAAAGLGLRLGGSRAGENR